MPVAFRSGYTEGMSENSPAFQFQRRAILIRPFGTPSTKASEAYPQTLGACGQSRSRRVGEELTPHPGPLPVEGRGKSSHAPIHDCACSPGPASHVRPFGKPKRLALAPSPLNGVRGENLSIG